MASRMPPQTKRSLTRASTQLLSRLLVELPRRSFLLVMLLGSALITASSVAYFDFDTLPPFVIEKLPVRFEALWLGSPRGDRAGAPRGVSLCLLFAPPTPPRF